MQPYRLTMFEDKLVVWNVIFNPCCILPVGTVCPSWELNIYCLAQMVNYVPRRNIAAWIKDNIPYDQFIFEHGKSVWLHLSFNTNGGRDVSNPTKVMTMWQGQMSTGLRKMR